MLNNTVYRLKHDKKLTIGYFGGSITEGAGASEPVRTWRAMTTAWFAEQYPDCEIIPIQAAIGGTGTELGIFRCDRDLASKKPDLVFMEFTINNSGMDTFEIFANAETILRKIYAANPYAEIVYLHTTSKDRSASIARGEVWTPRAAFSVIMDYYGILQLDIGEVLRAHVIADGGDWTTVLKDSVHPNDMGYAIYTEAIVNLLKRNLKEDGNDELLPARIPERLAKVVKDAARLENACEALRAAQEASLGKMLPEWCGEAASKALREESDETETVPGFRCVSESLCGRYDNYIEAVTPGAEFTYRFIGSCLGLYVMMAKDSGDLRYCIDGGKEESVRTWDGFCPRFNRAYGIVLPDKLEYGEHTVQFCVSDEKAEGSEGTAIRIGAFMVW
ncbi:MAG: SGNH/GDSL hydrolase family protein [Lachnospiraceae bacterium]|nr:SGNH/GDSL hydrolase family protein [Lachnospiraceae bacterium]